MVLAAPAIASLGNFLAARRARVSPADVGIFDAGDSRRVPGLRREEVALLAGVSVSYYTRLEQGQAGHASPQVLDALARALQLGAVEQRHLFTLAEYRPKLASRIVAAEEVAPGYAELMLSLGDTPAMVLGRCRDILAWNPVGHALFAGHIPASAVDHPLDRPNATELIFLDPHTRELYVDWADKAEASVGHLRLLAARAPDDDKLVRLVGRLSVQSPDFIAMWARHSIKTSTSSTYRMQHPLVGRLVVTQQLLTGAEHPEQTLLLCSTQAGSPSAAALQLLARLACEPGKPAG